MIPLPKGSTWTSGEAVDVCSIHSGVMGQYSEAKELVSLGVAWGMFLSVTAVVSPQPYQFNNNEALQG